MRPVGLGRLISADLPFGIRVAVRDVLPLGVMICTVVEMSLGHRSSVTLTDILKRVRSSTTMMQHFSLRSQGVY